jgi:hypothetical protein
MQNNLGLLAKSDILTRPIKPGLTAPLKAMYNGVESQRK